MKTLSVFAVALHPEGVDRNYYGVVLLWLEVVALHPEGVDRNTKALQGIHAKKRRPPPGGRG